MTRSCVLRRSMLLAILVGCGSQGLPDSGMRASRVESDVSVKAAQRFLGVVHDSVRSTASFPFDSPERTRWVFVPQARSGLPYARMRPAERAASEALLKTALSTDGLQKAMGIVNNESTLRTLEKESGVSNYERRNPELYYTWVFGHPAADSAWGWRFEGHHLSVNVTRAGKAVQVVAPMFMGANPARVPSGPEAGRRLLAAEEDLARELLAMLTPEQRARTVIAPTTFGDIVTRNDPQVGPLEQRGLAAADMLPEQRRQLRRLLEVYTGRIADESARSQLSRIDSAGFDRLHFAWAGSEKRGQAHYYRIHGPTLLIEYDNTQNNANHIHSVWRDLQNDFGGDLLQQHYARHRHD